MEVGIPSDPRWSPLHTYMEPSFIRRWSLLDTYVHPLPRKNFDIWGHQNFLEKVEKEQSVAKLLIEALSGLNEPGAECFGRVALNQMSREETFPYLSWKLVYVGDLESVVFLMMMIYGEESVVKAREILLMMKRMDLVKKLSDSTKKEYADERPSWLIRKVAMMAAAHHAFWDFSHEDSEDFSLLMENLLPEWEKDIEPVTRSVKKNIINLLWRYGCDALPIVRQMLLCIRRFDLAQKFPASISEFKAKYFSDECGAPQYKREEELAAVRQTLFSPLKDLDHKGLQKFRFLMQFTCFNESLPQIPKNDLERADTGHKLTELMVAWFGHQSVKVAREVLTDMRRTDLVQKLPQTNTGYRFVDQHMDELIGRVSNIGPILDELKAKNVIQQEAYDAMRALQTTQDKMRAIYSGPLKAGNASKNIFYSILQKKEPFLVADLSGKK